MSTPEFAYHLLLDPAEAAIAGQALRLLISDEAHEPEIRTLAREVIEMLERPPSRIRLEMASRHAGANRGGLPSVVTYAVSTTGMSSPLTGADEQG